MDLYYSEVQKDMTTTSCAGNEACTQEREREKEIGKKGREKRARYRESWSAHVNLSQMVQVLPSTETTLLITSMYNLQPSRYLETRIY